MKKFWNLLLVALVLGLAVTAWGEKKTDLTEWSVPGPKAKDGTPKATWISNTLWTGGATLRKIALGDIIKGAADDSMRIFTVQSANPREVMLFTDTSTAATTPMANRWRRDVLYAPGSGMQAVGIGDVDRDGDNDLIFGRAGASPYRLLWKYWTGSDWNTADTTITTVASAIRDLAIGDADNDGYADDIIFINGNAVMQAHWNGASWDSLTIWPGDGTLCYGVAIGDFDASNPGNEIAAVTYGGSGLAASVAEIYYDGAAWQSRILYSMPHATVDVDFVEVAVGDFDASNPGAEIAVANAWNTTNSAVGAVFEVYGSGTTWNQRVLYLPTATENMWDIACGDFLDENPGSELVVVSTSSPYAVRAIYGSGTSWANQVIFNTGGTSYGVVVGEVNKYRHDNAEIAVTGNYRVFAAEQYWPANDLVIRTGGPASYPFVSGEAESLWVRIVNGGTNDQPSFDLNFYINGSPWLILNNLSLAAGESLDVYLPFTFNTTTGEAVNFTIFHSLSPDESPANDTLGTMDPVAGLTRRFHDWVYEANTYKAEGFEYQSTFPPAGWVRINNDGGTQQWGWFTSTTDANQIHSGRLFTASRYESSTLRNDDWLITDAITLPPDSNEFVDHLKYFYRAYSASYPESLEVWALSGQTVNDTIARLWAGSFTNTSYQGNSISLASYAGQTINIGFRNCGLDEYYILLDDIHFVRSPVPPQITYTSPADVATGVLVNAPIVIGFSEPINTSSFTYTCVPDPGNWTVAWNATNDTVTLTHDNFATSTSYTFTVTAANDMTGNPLAAGAVPNPFSFTTSADGTPPTASIVSPAWGATGVALNEPIVIAFSEPMNTGSINGNIVPSIDMTLSWNAAGDTLTLTPDYPYAYSTLYNVQITSGTDLAGYNLQGLPINIAQFTTRANVGPVINVVQQPGDTYDGTGPFTVRAVITDPAKAGITNTWIQWQPSNSTTWTQANGTAGLADTFDFAIAGPFANGLVINAYVSAVDDAADTSYSNLIQFRILQTLPPTNLTAMAGDMFVQLNWAPPAESLYYYPGGTTYLDDLPATCIVSSRFTPKHHPFKVEAVRSSWNTGVGNAPVHFRIMGDDGNGLPDESTVLFDSVYTVGTGTWGDYLNLSDKNIVVASGDIHITWEILTSSQPRPRLNIPDVQQRGLLKWTDGNWYLEGGVWLNRLFVSYSSYLKNGVALKSARINRNSPILSRVNHVTKPTADNDTKQAANLPAFAMLRNISGYSVHRGSTAGGPYSQVGTATATTYMDNTAENGNPYYYVVRAEFSAPDTFSAFSNEATATPAAKPILLVDDDCSQVGWPDRQGIYTAALDGAGYSGQYTVYETDGTVYGSDGPSAPWYNGRSHVIWFSGGQWEQQNTLTLNDETNLAAYLDAGGRLFYCAQDYLYDRYPSAGAFTPGQFPYDYLGLASVSQDVIMNPYNIAGVAGSLAEGLNYAVSEDPSVGTYADNLTKRSVAGTYDVLDVTAKVGEKTGVAYDNGTFRTVFFTTLFEDITDGTNTKAELMYRILNWLATGVEGSPTTQTLPTRFELGANYPNPVRSSTTIKFGLPKDSDVRIEVYNIAGQKVKTLASGKLNAGYHQITWRGQSDNGQKVAAGVYLVRMVTPEFTETRKMTVIR